MRLSHIHLPKPIPYTHSLRLQEALIEKHFAHKTLLRRNDAPLRPLPPPPPPTLLTLQTLPTYTVGRRHLTANPLSESQISFLTGASRSNNDTGSSATPTTVSTHQQHQQQQQQQQHEDLATFYASPRGGLLTYHAPGQLTAYLVVNLRTHGLTPRCYIRMLEKTVMRTCARHGVANTLTTDDPGVWIGEPVHRSHSTAAAAQGDDKKSAGSDASRGNVDELCELGQKLELQEQNENRNSNDSVVKRDLLRATNRKICAIGVHVSRGITSHGIGLNVFDALLDAASPLRAFYTLPRDNIYTSAESHAASGSEPRLSSLNVVRGDGSMQDSEVLAPGYLSWGFNRIVACGLEGKSVTWLAREQNVGYGNTPTLGNVADSLAEEAARGLMIKTENIDRFVEDQDTVYKDYR